MKKRSTIIIVVIATIIAAVTLGGFAYGIYSFVSFLTGGYNSIMYKFLSNADNYTSINLTYKRAYYYNQSIYEQVNIDGKTVQNDILGNIYLECYKNNSDSGQATQVKFEIFPLNNDILIQNNFYNDIAEDAEITVRATQWIYMDNKFYFIAEIEYANKCYLNFEQGLENIISVMDNKKY